MHQTSQPMNAKDVATPFLEFARADWAAAYTQPFPHWPVESITPELIEVYWPLAQLLNQLFLEKMESIPYVIGITGSVAVGKSVLSKMLQRLLMTWPEYPQVELLSTDSFIYPQAVLEKHHLTQRKGFPESYHQRAWLRFLRHLKAGDPALCVSEYSHEYYDIIPNSQRKVQRTDIVIIEGLNILQSPQWHASKRLAQDFFDFIIYVDAESHWLKQWYIERFMRLRHEARQKPTTRFYESTLWSDSQALDFATMLWETINAPNLQANILPFKQRADLILEKGPDHSIQTIRLRKL
ncbi:MAG: type I pantothenate kinase [Gammaproteobacteria bacterium]